jgi:drug/metabolite transporter (DMT)-like permease
MTELLPENAPKSGLNRNLLILHFTVFIWGFTGILGALITMPAIQLVWYRVVIAVVSLFLYFKFNRTVFRVDRRSFLTLVFTGALVGGHWILFFAAIKLSTVSVTLVCLSSMTLFTAILEPLFGKKKISPLEIVSGILIITGILLIFKFETQYTKGIITGLSSALFASLFSIINSKQVKRHDAPVIAFYELSGALVWISLFLFATQGFGKAMQLSPADAGYLLILGTICTSLAYVAGVSVMRELSAFKVALITNLEPVYGIIMAFVFFGDMKKMTSGFWAGAIIILSTIFLFPFVQKQLIKRQTRA